ncbi:MAG: hypothetical protein J5I92_15220 [Thiogranum sp.]|nr:hypothetical protein [Thiogranum sp.]
MTKMDMVWVATANLLHPNTQAIFTVTKSQIEAEVDTLFGASITPVMIERHLVNSVDRMADKDQPQRGGSRNRYLVRNGGEYRLYKRIDQSTDAWEKTGPTNPDKTRVDQQFVHLIDWYEGSYY